MMRSPEASFLLYMSSLRRIPFALQNYKKVFSLSPKRPEFHVRKVESFLFSPCFLSKR